jgi:hypothetical protein
MVKQLASVKSEPKSIHASRIFVIDIDVQETRFTLIPSILGHSRIKVSYSWCVEKAPCDWQKLEAGRELFHSSDTTVTGGYKCSIQSSWK